MTMTTTHSYTLTRTFELEVEGTWYGPEPDVGIMSAYFEINSIETEDGKPFELTPEEERVFLEQLEEPDYD
jgi:hypothetical protein